MLHTKKQLLIVVLIAITSIINGQENMDKILICYGDFYPEKVKNYEYVIIEPSIFSKADVALLKAQNKHVLAYISLGEVNESATHFKALAPESLGKNEIWNSHIIDLSAPVTQKVVLALIDTHIVQKGFDGLFLDNIDNYTKFGPTPEKKKDLLRFLETITTRHKDIIVMQNAGLLIVEDTKPFIDVIAVESVITNYSFEKESYRLRDRKASKLMVKELEHIKEKHNIPVILIEYADSKKLKNKILDIIRCIDYPYFIGKIELQKLPVEEN